MAMGGSWGLPQPYKGGLLFLKPYALLKVRQKNLTCAKIVCVGRTKYRRSWVTRPPHNSLL